MTAQQYLEGLLAKYSLKESDVKPLKRKRAVIEQYLREKYDGEIVNFYYSGSYAKGTAINLKYDLDICIYFKPDSFSTLSDMYNNVYQVLKQEYNVKKQDVSIGLTYGGDNIDIVPARKIEDSNNDANLYVNNTGGQIKTNIPLHKEYISKNKCRPIIKLMKI